MRRVLLLGGLVLAVVAPTALVESTHAARRAQPGAYSVQQVLRVFRAEGVTLRRQPVAAKFGFERFDSPSSDISVSVYGAAPRSINQLYVSAMAGGPPKIADRGNLGLLWARHDDREVRAALSRLKYSPADALRAQPPTYVLHRGWSRTISSNSNDQVDCVVGSSDESETPADVTGVASASYSDGAATLTLTRPTSSTITFVCS